MSIRFQILIVAVMIVFASGCRGRNACQTGCGLNPLAGLGSCTIAPPGTGSYGAPPANDPFYGNASNTQNPGNNVPTIPAGWRAPNGNSQGVPAQNASINQTSYSPTNRTAQIPMNNVVSSTQTSSIRPSTTLAENTNVNLSPSQNQQAFNQPVTFGMPVNDATNVQAPTRFADNGRFNPLNPNPSRSVNGTFEYNVVPTRSGQPQYPYNVPYGYNGGVMAQNPNGRIYNGQSNSGWQQRN